MNNPVRNAYGQIVGFRCLQCGGVFQQMWDNVCNGCRHSDEENEKLRDEIKKLTAQIASLKPLD